MKMTRYGMTASVVLSALWMANAKASIEKAPISAPAWSLPKISSLGKKDSIKGKISLTLWMDQTNQVHFLEVQDHGSRIVGRSSLGGRTFNLVRREIPKGKTSWEGTTGKGPVRLQCSSTNCSGIFESRKTQFSLKNRSTLLEGSLHTTPFDAAHLKDSIEIRGKGSLLLRKTGAGSFEGIGFLSQNLQTSYSAALKTEGSFDSPWDPALFMMVLVGPLVTAK